MTKHRFSKKVSILVARLLRELMPFVENKDFSKVWSKQDFIKVMFPTVKFEKLGFERWHKMVKKAQYTLLLVRRQLKVENRACLYFVEEMGYKFLDPANPEEVSKVQDSILGKGVGSLKCVNDIKQITGVRLNSISLPKLLEASNAINDLNNGHKKNYASTNQKNKG